MSSSQPPAATTERDAEHYPFIESAKEGSASAVREWLSYPGIDVNFVDNRSGMTALHLAAARRAKAVVKVLAADKKCDFTILDRRGRTAATLAFEVGRDPALGRYLYDKEYEQLHPRLSGTELRRKTG
jgi:ankyrin repeat protein